MPETIYYPPANRTAQWFGPGNYTMPKISKLLWHSTETTGWPSYDGGKKAPTLTYKPATREWRQHFPLNGSARALQDPTGTPVRENRDDVVQVEIITYATKIRQLTAANLEDLADLLVFLNKNWQVPLRAAPIWLPFPDSYGDSPARMTSEEYDAFTGMCGHMHASGNVHGDPGDIDVATILAIASKKTGAVTTQPNLTIATKAIVLAYYGQPMNTVDSYWADARQMLAWGRSLNLQPVKPADEAAWTTAIVEDRFTDAGKTFRACVHHLQDYFGLPIGDDLLAVILRMKRYGYTIIAYDGKAI